MPMSAGSRIGSYEVTAEIGAGGMGIVYRARDTKLQRDVALKVLPDLFASDPERLARFQREAQVLASLNHPNIAAIYGLEEAEGVKALVLELVEGPTLADRIAQGPIPLDEAVPIAKQIAEALEAAHEHGIIHRDLKPANIKIRPDGTVKVLDFGLAKLSEPTGSAAVAQGFSPAGGLSQSPTITSPAAMTMQGVILGTAAYMSPEQAKGKPVDKRADIWAFGCVLYEMLTGRRAFEGDDVTETLAAVVRAEPDWSLLPPEIAPAVRRFLRRCLAKDRRERVRDIGDMLLALHGVFEAAPSEVAAIAVARRALTWKHGAVGIAALLVGGLMSGWIVWTVSTPGPPIVARFEIAAPSLRFSGKMIGISPDGRTIVYVEEQGGRSRLMRREIGELEALPIRGAEEAAGAGPSIAIPFFSPDGQWVAFGTGGRRLLRKVPVMGGPAVTICECAESINEASWADDGTIVFATMNGLWRVSDTGGTPTQLLDTGRPAFKPEVLPGAQAVIFDTSEYDGGERTIEILLLATGERRRLTQGRAASYASSGHLVFARNDGFLWAARFDPRRMELLGEPVPLTDAVFGETNGPVQYAVADNGSLIYVPRQETGGRTLVWVSRDGTAVPALSEPAQYAYPRLSPDDARVAVSLDRDVWVFGLERPTRVRLTFGDRSAPQGAAGAMTVWMPEGQGLTFSREHARDGEPFQTTLEWTSAAGGEPSHVLHSAEALLVPTSWSPDGRTLAFYQLPRGVAAGRDVWVLNTSADPQAREWLATSFEESAAAFSPDGRWIAYVSTSSGRHEVYVRPYPGPGEQVAVSTQGGTEPVWSRDGRELFYRNGEAMMAVSVEAGPTLSLGQPHLLFEGPYRLDPSTSRANPFFDVASDGRFLMVAPPALSIDRIVVVQNWHEELKRLVPAN